MPECGTRLTNFPEQLSFFFQNNCQYFCRTAISIFAENLPVALQKTFQHGFRTPFSIFAEQIPVVLQNTSQQFFEIISQFLFFLCITRPSISRNSFRQYVCRVRISTFAENLQNTTFFVPVKCKYLFKTEFLSFKVGITYNV